MINLSTSDQFNLNPSRQLPVFTVEIAILCDFGSQYSVSVIFLLKHTCSRVPIFRHNPL